MVSIIENDFLRVSIKSKGAELCGLYEKQQGVEYMWQADPAYWAKSSPVLFPIVGALKKDQYIFNDEHYSLSRHGFARDKVFEIKEHGSDRIAFVLRSTDDTLIQYPFLFLLKIEYQLKEHSLIVSYEVVNTGNEAMFFSIGAHPAFKIPLEDTLQYSDYELVFNKKETAKRWSVTKEGLIKTEFDDFFKNSANVSLEKSLFYNDALVFKDLQSDTIKLQSSKGKNSLVFSFTEFPYFGIWAAKDADFICLEPWSGIADSVDHNLLLADKEGILKLEPEKAWSAKWMVSCL